MKRTYFYLMLLMFNVQFSMFNELQAQEAFYIYRNDGDFNGFFYDEVVRMGYSKLGPDSVEYDVYVVQEIETKDSLYRIPLCAIDSIGFQQPDIIFNENFYDITAEDCPYKGYQGVDPLYSYEVDSLGFMLYWEPCEFDSDAHKWICHEERLPKVGDVLYIPNGAWNESTSKYDMPLIGKVTSVTEYLEYREHTYKVICTFVDDIHDVFEQFISVEQVGVDENGEAYTRMAGMNKIKRRVEGNKDLTLVSFSGSITPINEQIEKLKIRLGLDLSLSVKCIVAYNISRSDFRIVLNFKEDAEFGASFTVSGVIDDTTTCPLAGVPIVFPTWLPILQINPGVGAFLKVTGDVNFTITTPKFAVHCTQTITIDGNGVHGNDEFKTGTDDPDNTWGIELSLNGSAQAGTAFPAKFETASWMKKMCFTSMGFDVQIGPKFEAAFTLDPVSLASLDAYNTFKNTQIKFSDTVVGVEGTAVFSAGSKRKKYKVFESNNALRTLTLNLFPEFENVKLGPKVFYTRGDVNPDDWDRFDRLPIPYTTADICPRGTSLPYKVGVGVYNKEKKIVYGRMADAGMYGFFNTWNKETMIAELFDGTYTVCPIIDCFGYTIPVWDAGKEVIADTPFFVCEDDMYEKWKGYLRVQYVLNKDEGIRIDCDDESLGFYADLVERRPMNGQNPEAEEYFEEVTFEYNITNHNWTGVYPKPFTVSSWRTKPEDRRRETKVSLAVPWPRVDY